MKSLKKVYLYIAIALVLIFSMILIILGNINHAKTYEYNGKVFSEQEVFVHDDNGVLTSQTKEVIVDSKVKLKFINSSVVRITSYKNGNLDVTHDCLYVISDGYLYINSGLGTGYSLVGKINAYRIQPCELNRLTSYQVYKCSVTNVIRIASICVVSVGIVIIAVEGGLIVYKKLKDKMKKQTIVTVEELN